MNYHFIIITPESGIIDKRMVRLKERLEKKWRTTLVPSCQRQFETDENPVFVLPFSLSQRGISDVLSLMPEGCSVFGGAIGEDAVRLVSEKSIKYTNVLSDEEFCQENAALTAEAALSLLISSTEISLCGVRVAVFGYGRIGSRLARMLISHGASVKVFTSNKTELSDLSSRGINSAHLWKRQDIDSFSALINTIPLHHVIPCDTLARLEKSAVVIDLASGNNNVDWQGLKQLGIKGEHATSLPGKYSPASAAAVLERAILKNLE